MNTSGVAGHDLSVMLHALAESAAGPFGEALTMPGGLYHSKQCAELERARIFEQEWHCVGRLAEIPNPGDFIAFDIADQPIFVVRQKSGDIGAFRNVCVHRCAQLLSGSGNVTRISCPYHSWTYLLDGQLIGAPFMHERPGFNVKDHRLPAVACEIWEGFIYVTLNPDAEPVSQRLAELQEVVGQYRMADYVPIICENEVWDTNWKCLVENFMDAYHIHRVHAKSFGASSRSEERAVLVPGTDHFTYHYVDMEKDHPNVYAHSDNTWLGDEHRNRVTLACIFPTHTLQLQPNMLWYLSIQPQGVEQVRIRWAVSVPREILDASPDPEAHIEHLRSFLGVVNSEDRPTVEGVFSSTRTTNAPRGPMSHLERNVFDFDRYLARRLC